MYLLLCYGCSEGGGLVAPGAQSTDFLEAVTELPPHKGAGNAVTMKCKPAFLTVVPLKPAASKDWLVQFTRMGGHAYLVA